MSNHSVRLAIVAGALVLLSACSEEQSAANPPRPIKYSVANVVPSGEEIVQTGEIKPRFETPMSFRLNGQLDFRAEIGTSVRAGDVVARVDKTPAEIGMLTARADLSTAKAGLDLAQVTADRNRELFAKNITPKAQMQEADANLATAKAKVEAAQAAVANAGQTLAYSELKAGRDGVISAAGANEGQVVSAGQMIVTLISETERDAVFDIPQKLLALKSEDPQVEVKLISDPEIKATGRVRELTPSADPSTRTYRAKVSLDEGAELMPLGAAVTGYLRLSPKDLVSLPAAALTQDNGQTAVFVFDATSKTLRYRDVQVERYTDATVMISEGLSDGDVVATAGVSKLRAGETVSLDEEASK
ncbi:efflux RND transporter periplasmic adaptor subunit [Rhizobium sp. GR12]|uniref:efflux RND transporter periplasmic adaptor subunit n=1 Tax=Rhizobium sp. GR12 TaxID=3053925 RepID=UPI002FBE4AEE